MSTSPLVGRRRFPPTKLDAQRPVSAHLARNVIANNVLHYADTKCDHWVNWVAPKPARVGGTNTQLYRTPAPVSASWARTAIWGPFRVTRRSDGTPYPVRMELFGSSSGAGTNVEFALAVMSDVPSGSLGAVEDPSFLGGRGVAFVATSSATPAWLAAAAGDKIFVPSYEVASARRRRSTLTDTGGTPTEVACHEVYVVAYTKSANPAVATPRIHGAHVSQYVGL